MSGKMSSELFESLELIEEEKGISRDVILDALESALISAYRKHFGAAQDVHVIFDEETGAIRIVARKKVVEEVEDRESEISLDEAKKINEPNMVVKKCRKFRSSIGLRRRRMKRKKRL